MNDFEEKKSKKGIGCLGVIFIILFVIILLAGSIYLFLPKILSSVISGGAVSSILPEGVQKNTQNLKALISDNIALLEEYGLSTDEAVEIVSAVKYETLEECMEDIKQSSITNSSSLIDTVSKHIDLSSADLNKIKSNFYTEFEAEELSKLITNFKESPMMSRLNFRVIKGTIIEILEMEE